MSKRNKEHTMPTHIRKGKKYPAEDFIQLVRDKYFYDKMKHGRALIDGDRVGVKTKRILTFRDSGTSCHCCGLKGLYFVKEKQRYTKSSFYHLNLYGLDGGREVMLTSDHIKPLKHGGKDRLTNRQTLCAMCNNVKAHQKIQNADLIWKVFGREGIEVEFCGYEIEESIEPALYIIDGIQNGLDITTLNDLGADIEKICETYVEARLTDQVKINIQNTARGFGIREI